MTTFVTKTPECLSGSQLAKRLLGPAPGRCAAISTPRRPQSASFSLSLSRCTPVPGHGWAQVTGHYTALQAARPPGCPAAPSSQSRLQAARRDASHPARPEPAVIMASGGTQELGLLRSSSARPRGSRAFWERICVPHAPSLGFFLRAGAHLTVRRWGEGGPRQPFRTVSVP